MLIKYKEDERISIIIMSFLLILLVGLILLTNPRKTNAQTIDPLDVWIDKLASVEQCTNKNDKENKFNCKILDSNKRYSYSCLQFQADTFVEMSDKYDIHGSIYDCDTQKKLAKAMILDNADNWKHWYNSTTKKIGVPPIAQIKVNK